MTAVAWVLPAAPLLAALVGFLLPARARVPAAILGGLGALVALVASIALTAHLGRSPDGQSITSGVKLGDFGELDVTLGISVGLTAAVIAIAVGAVALAVQVYSAAYLRSDTNYGPYAAQISLFTAAMLAVVVADDLVVLLAGWEVMGACSYLLIAHDRSLPEAPGAAVKAFLVTRVGDIGFLLGIAVLAVHARSLSISAVLAADYSPGVLTAATLLLLAGVFGKSAQFPLHSWLPDAMAGPTPISALIHAATMVAAGVYVVARLYPLFADSPTALTVLAVAASITMVWGACCAMAIDDIKRVLAWSTVSQIGYMTGALAVGAVPAALFHLLSHAAFKALLFLCAGAVIHAIGSNYFAAAGGLRTRMPVTFWTMTIGLAALIGLPPLSGFWSKEGILFRAEHAETWQGWLVFAAGMLTVALTGWYATRLWLRTFFGQHRGSTEVVPHDPPGLMRWPLLVLAVPAALLGFLALPSFGLDRALGITRGDLVGLGLMTVVALLLAGAGMFTAWKWSGGRAAVGSTDPALRLGLLRPIFAHGFFFDYFQGLVVVYPIRALARAMRIVDVKGVDGTVEGLGSTVSRLSTVVGKVHAVGLHRYVTAALAGALLIAAGTVTAQALGWM
ncbi:MAG: NADH-quinone oxidoreductase subunit L [Longispora sp.]|nr:NADH-quinone oxidoreductase subunit L [Longispora sp. (in: high G+C Gram-positive bacteria)]